MDIRGRNTARAQEGMEIRSWKAIMHLFLISVSLLAAASSSFSLPHTLLQPYYWNLPPQSCQVYVFSHK